MFAATNNTALPSRPFPQKILIGPWSRRHPSASIAIRMTSGIWNMSLGILMLSYGYLLGLLPLTGSALLFWAVYIVARDQSESRRNGQS
jgi:hypothetical protein